jgi:hypothetical protein
MQSLNVTYGIRTVEPSGGRTGVVSDQTQRRIRIDRRTEGLWTQPKIVCRTVSRVNTVIWFLMAKYNRSAYNEREERPAEVAPNASVGGVALR